MARLLAGTLMLVLAMCARQTAAADPPASADASDPTSKLFDVPAVDPGKRAADLVADRAQWRGVPEDKLDHAFTGDLVLMNDRMAVLIPRRSGTMQIYSNAGGEYHWRAQVMPQLPDGQMAKVEAIAIRENTAAAVMVELAYRQGDTASRIAVRVAAGERMVEIKPLTAVVDLGVRDESERVVVPDFFADDVVYPAGEGGAPRGLPVDNCLLGLANHGDTILAFIWRVGGQNATMCPADRSGASGRNACRFDLAEGKSLWIAALEQKGIWHQQELKTDAATGELSWKPPFAARWRVDFVRPDGVSVSRGVLDSKITGAAPAGGHIAWMENGGVRIEWPPGTGAAAGLVIAYPIDRSRATPLNSYCLVDVLRNAIGFGPCQYVLDAEKLGDADTPAPEQVTHWVEKQFEKPASRREADVIRQRLADMVTQIKRTDARIAQYGGLGDAVRHACLVQSQGRPLPVAAELTSIVRDIAPGASGGAGVAVAPLAGSLAALAERENVQEEARRIGIQIRALAGEQDYALAKLRMAIRRLRVQCRMIKPASPAESQLVAEVRKAIDEISK